MSSLFPARSFSPEPEPDHPKLQQRPLAPAEARGRWEVRAAQWRAHELAEAVFGSVQRMGMSAIRTTGALRGLLRLDVPFADLDSHRAREARFLAAVDADPLLSTVRLVYVIGPQVAP